MAILRHNLIIDRILGESGFGTALEEACTTFGV
jgi:hypothetical protein